MPLRIAHAKLRSGWLRPSSFSRPGPGSPTPSGADRDHAAVDALTDSEVTEQAIAGMTAPGLASSARSSGNSADRAEPSEIEEFRSALTWEIGDLPAGVVGGIGDSEQQQIPRTAAVPVVRRYRDAVTPR